ncbi:adenylate cyclase [Noviherbaspirillum humi]|uniref:Adenylate cyclase n=1 Tax=Noviherbaspirillum humi TaxID=1688639 RepID=A0A239J0U4_9BURK|nr:adenylate/guanylate cyclase domain-containing protein [Noviherbaspirillum humi]SNS99531.1 adenylate cyclase [Noviherbaspirillum humi]
MLRKNLLRHAIGLLLLAIMLGHAARLLQLPFIAPLERLIYDTRLRLTMPRTVDERIVILDIDEKSLAEIGRWPWSRNRMAALMDRLFDRYHIRLLGIDIVMAEPDESSGLKVLDRLERSELKGVTPYRSALARMRQGLDYDRLFQAALRDRPVILGYYLANGGIDSGALPPPQLTAAGLGGRRIDATSWSNFGGNLAPFQEAAAGGGYFNPIIDPDGILRRVPLLAEYKGAYYPSFSLAMVQALLGNARVAPSFGESADGSYEAVESLDLVRGRRTVRRIPVDENLAAWIPFRGFERSYRYFSVADVLAGRTPLERLENKIAILGTSAPGLRDQRATPVSEIFPGMEVHANLVSAMLDGAVKERPAYADALEMLMLLVPGALLIALLPRCPPLRAAGLVLALLAALAAVNVWAWQSANLVLPLASAMLLVLALYVFDVSYGYFVETRAKHQITRRFGQYVPPELVDEMSRNPGGYTMENRKANLSVLFSDVRGFTTISEGMAPEALAQLMNEYLTAMTLVIRRHRGTLDKYIGDAIVAFWGAPMDDSRHALNAVLTALEMQQAVAALNRSFAARGWPSIAIGIGINTGDMTVGNMGSSIRLAYTVMGDAVNLGARLESKTKEYGVGILVGEATRDAVEGIVFRELDRVQVKGKEQLVAIFEPLGQEGEVDDAALAELAQWQRMLACYRGRDWDGAERLLREMQAAHPNCRRHALYLERIAAFRASPPPADWNGVTRFDSK